MSKMKPEHLKSIVTYDGEDLYAAGLFGGGCQFPVMNLVGRCQDQVFLNMPNYFGRIYPGVTQPVITGQAHTYTPPEEGDECASGVIETDITGCEFALPQQVEIDYCHAPMPWKKLWRSFCRSRGLQSSCPPPFTTGGDVEVGNRLAMPFLHYALNAFAQGYLQVLIDGGLAGDSSMPLQPDGLYTQLENGWDIVDGNGACDIWNKATCIDWAALTAGSVDCDGNPNAGSYGATIDAGATIDIWGEAQDVGGFGLAELMAAFMDAVDEYTQGMGGVSQYEIHGGKRFRNCMVEAVSCLRVCCNADLDVSESNARYASLKGEDFIDFYPYRRDQVAMLETPALDGCIWFGPREIGGCPTYGNIWEPVAQMFDDLSDIYGDGFRPGLVGGSLDGSPVIAETATVLAENFEAAAFGTTVQKIKQKCLEACTTACFTPLAYHRCTWLKICGLTDCKQLRKPLNAADVAK